MTRKEQVLKVIADAGELGIGHGDIYGVLGSGPIPYNTLRRITQELRAAGLITALAHKNRFTEKLFVAATPAAPVTELPQSESATTA